MEAKNNKKKFSLFFLVFCFFSVDTKHPAFRNDLIKSLYSVHKGLTKKLLLALKDPKI